MTHAQQTPDHVEACKAELKTVLEKYTSFMKSGWLFAVGEQSRAEECINEAVDELFHEYTSEAREEIEREEAEEQRKHERLESMGRI